MRTLSVAILMLLLAWANPAVERKTMKVTPVLLVNRIEDSLPFWVDRIGFTKTAEVPEGDRLGFVILEKDGAQVMLQTWASAEKDVPGIFPKPHVINGVGLFAVVDDFADIRKRLAAYKIVVAERVTFYGMREIGVRDPDGHLVIFAANEPK